MTEVPVSPLLHSPIRHHLLLLEETVASLTDRLTLCFCSRELRAPDSRLCRDGEECLNPSLQESTLDSPPCNSVQPLPLTSSVRRLDWGPEKGGDSPRVIQLKQGQGGIDAPCSLLTHEVSPVCLVCPSFALTSLPLLMLFPYSCANLPSVPSMPQGPP